MAGKMAKCEQGINGKGQNLRRSGNALKLSLDLFKIMVPVAVAVKILQDLDLIRYLAMPLDPVMKLVGLPAEMGIVWATAMLNNLYSGIIVLLGLVKDAPITEAQATVLCTMMLVAHTLPVELKIAQKSGPRMIFQAVSRLGSALLLGWMLHTYYTYFGFLQGPVRIIFSADAAATRQGRSWLSWAVSEAQSLFFIFLIILGLFMLMRVLRKIKVLDAMNRLLDPLLRLLGIGPKASTVTVIGLTMGVAYGGGLIIKEARTGTIPKEDVFYSLTLMGLSHGLVEDTLLMVMAGGSLSGLLWARLVFSLVVVALLVRITPRLSPGFCERFLWGRQWNRR
jgi:hypothetical protein